MFPHYLDCHQILDILLACIGLLRLAPLMMDRHQRMHNAGQGVLNQRSLSQSNAQGDVSETSNLIDTG